MMREFEYFLYENFDADLHARNPDNPRLFLGKQTDELLSRIAGGQGSDCISQAERLIRGGILRKDGEGAVFDCPVFLREDGPVLHDAAQRKASALADLLERGMNEIKSCCARIQNGFSVERNLYHILCGMVFDGYFFDYLSDRGALATSRLHPTGLDYLTIIYEKCDELRSLSDGLLCSYNRLVNGRCSLQSFGDAQADRFDFYRFFRLRESGGMTGRFLEAEAILAEGFGGADKDALLNEAFGFVKTGTCSPAALGLLELFGYAENGRICVPVFTPHHQNAIRKIEALAEHLIGEAMADALLELAGEIEITAVRHGVNRLEIANELYHILFGMLNEALVTRGIVAEPRQSADEGRYLKCIEIYW